MFNLHGVDVVIGAGDEVVAAGGKFQHRDVGLGAQVHRLLQEVFGVGEELVRSLCHIRLIDRDCGSLRDLEKRPVNAMVRDFSWSRIGAPWLPSMVVGWKARRIDR